MTSSDQAGVASANITQRIAELGDWRGEMLAWVRALIHEADPAIVEEWKWRGVPVWAHDGIVCTGETYKEVVKLTFARGAALADPQKLFNSSLEGNVRRAIDLRKGEEIKVGAFGVRGVDPGGGAGESGCGGGASAEEEGRVCHP